MSVQAVEKKRRRDLARESAKFRLMMLDNHRRDHHLQMIPCTTDVHKSSDETASDVYLAEYMIGES